MSMKKMIREIQEGKNLRENLSAFRAAAVPAYREFAALDLTFTAYIMLQEAMEEREGLTEQEEKILDAVLAALGRLGRGEADYPETAWEMDRLRHIVTGKMDVFTAYTDRLLCYEYVMNHMELKFLPEGELNDRLSAFDEGEYMQMLMSYLFADRDQSVIHDKLRFVIGEIPIHMTKGKLFERIAETLTLYRDSQKSALDNFLYMIRTSAMLYESKERVEDHPELEELICRIETADYGHIERREFEQLVEEKDRAAEILQQSTDFYCSIQKVINGIYALCLILPCCDGGEKLPEKNCREVWVCLSKKEYRDEMLWPLEGLIEDRMEKIHSLESVLSLIHSSCREETEEAGLSDFIEKFCAAADLLSDSLFIDLGGAAEDEVVDERCVREATEKLLDELSLKLGQVSRPVKRAVMAVILQKLPLQFNRPEEVEEYIRVNLFGCQNRAEKCVVMELLRDQIRAAMFD